MKVLIRFQAEYRYDAVVSFSPHHFRLFPRSDHFITVHRVEFESNEGGDVQFRRDLFDNHMASCFYPNPAEVLHCRLELELGLREMNAFHFLLATHATEMPFQYTDRERKVLAPYLEPHHGAIPLPFWSPPATPQATVETLVALNRSLHDNLEYTRRDEGVARTPEDTLQAGRGACRDFMVLLAETLRRLGIAARMASGYLCEFEAEEKRAEGALHAWVEAYLPGAGWVGMDPTNGVFCNHNHITAAIGMTPADVAPIEGNYYHPERVQSAMTSRVEILTAGETL